MKRGALIFWMLYSLFFAVPFPMILYYSINNQDDINSLWDKNPWLALSLLVVSILLWCFLLMVFYRKWVLNVFVSKRNIEYLKQHGERREARILTATKLSKSNADYDTYELTLGFKNLVGTEIQQKSGVNDARPIERRFEVGKKVEILIDQEMKRIPYFIFASTEATIHFSVVILRTLGWLLLLAAITGYYLYAYQSESQGMGWRFMSFGHPLIVCPLVLLSYKILVGLFSKLSGQADDAALIKFKGVQTTAKLINASQTGTYINEQPMILFDLEYTDDRQQKHRGNLKKIVNLLDLNMTKQEHIDIFYLKEKPERIAFASDLNEIS